MLTPSLQAKAVALRISEGTRVWVHIRYYILQLYIVRSGSGKTPEKLAPTRGQRSIFPRFLASRPLVEDIARRSARGRCAMTVPNPERFDTEGVAIRRAIHPDVEVVSRRIALPTRTKRAGFQQYLPVTR